jgi:hypothetical protein
VHLDSQEMCSALFYNIQLLGFHSLVLALSLSLILSLPIMDCVLSIWQSVVHGIRTPPFEMDVTQFTEHETEG